jgi:hypothetical protein
VRAICKFCQDFAQNNGLTIGNELVAAYVEFELVKYDFEKDQKIASILHTFTN